MASVFYLVIMFMVYTMMVSNNNNNLHCQAAAASSEEIDYKCLLSIGKIIEEMIDAGDGHGPNFVSAPNGSLILNPKSSIRKRCLTVPKTELSGRDLVLCKCKVQDFGKGNEEKSPGLKLLNALDADKQLAISCGFNDTDCDAAFRSVQSKCQTNVREAMKACGPMVKAAAEKAEGNRRPLEYCCSLLDTVKCRCSIDKNRWNSTDIEERNKFLHSVNDTFHDKCSLSAELYNRPVCKLSENNYLNIGGNTMRIKDFSCASAMYTLSNTMKKFSRKKNNMNICGPILEKPQKQANDLAVEAPPLVDRFTGCCSSRESCKCDPSSISCCQKLGKISANKWNSCMCELLTSKTTPASTLDFLNFVRSNDIQIKSCQKISPVYTGTCVIPPPFHPTAPDAHADLTPEKLRQGFKTPNNPNP